MLEEIFNLIKGNATESVINNPAVPNDQNDAVVAEATNTVASGLRNIVAGGGLENLLSMFGGGQKQGSGLMSNPIVNMMVGHFAGKLMSKFNMAGGQANQVATSLIPNVLSSLINKTNEGSNGFSLEGLLNSITGGQATQQQGSGGFNLQDLVTQFAGGGQQANSGGGGGGLMDILSKFTEGAQQQQQKNGGGGLMDLIEGFIKK
jgi:hypothetical protein